MHIPVTVPVPYSTSNTSVLSVSRENQLKLQFPVSHKNSLLDKKKQKKNITFPP